MGSMTDNMSVEPEQDANSALTELDKGLRSTKVGEQCEAIVKFPRLFEKYPFPILINSSLLKLADVFRVGNNFLRVWILRVCQQSEKHLDKIMNVDEFVRRIFSVMHSNDPIARALTLRTLGAVAGIIPERKQVHHGIRRSLDSHDAVEVDAAVYAATQFAAQSKKFAVSMCNKVSEMIQGLATPAHRKLQLIPILQHMHHDISTAGMVRVLCTQLLTSYPAQDFVVVTLSALTQLTAATLVDIPQQVKLLVTYLRNDKRWVIKAEALKGLHRLASEGAHLWPQDCIEDIVQVALTSDKNYLLSAALDVLLVLTRTALTCHNQYDNNSPVRTLCRRCYIAGNTVITAKAILIATSIFCYCYEENLPIENVSDLVDAIESLFLIVTCDDSNKKLYELKACLKCAVRLCKACPTLSNQFVEIISTRLFLSDTCNSLLCEALGAIGGLQPSALKNILLDIIKKLHRFSQLTDLTPDQIHTKVTLCTLLFQSQVGFEWNPDLRAAVKIATSGNHYWSNYKIARAACRYGHHEISHEIFAVLKDRVSSEHYYFWLTSLQELSKGEAVLSSNEDLVVKLSTSLTHYSKALASLRAASTPSQTLGFQAEYVKVRCEFLQCLLQLVHAGNALCTAPPPAIAAAIVASTRDELQRYGHVTQQLRKCVKEFRSCGELYQKLYQSAFDADPESLKNIQIYQQMCFLMASSVEKVCQLNSQEEFVLDFNSQQNTLEIEYLMQCCQQSIALAESILLNKELKPITHQHINALTQQVKILAETSLCIPRYFFQTLQSTSVKLNISPQPRVVGESVSVQGGSHLAVKVEGVLVHDARPGIFRTASEIVITLVSQLQTRQHNQTDNKVNDVGSVVTQTVTPHKDFFTAQFLLAFTTGGQYSLSVEAAIADENGHVWKTGPKVTLAVKSHEENSKSSSVQNSTRQFVGPRF
ncbi:hypothetical protein RUM43_010558 [Polyplax serrata]|uniref:Integrator complex subunit 7 n=1 Tax=Polyplax serrata TaxID=468196 RepID=A0AAN8S4X9_POLSC